MQNVELKEKIYNNYYFIIQDPSLVIKLLGLKFMLKIQDFL